MIEPVVSICCLTYNHEKYISQTLESFLMQETEYTYEIVVYDDASTDSTQQIIKEYMVKYPDRIKAILQEENQYSKGEHVLKLLFSQASGKYIAFCEGDDFWTAHNKLQKQIEYMEKHSDCVCSYHAVNYIRNEKITGNDVRGMEERDCTVEEIIAGGGLYCASASLCFLTKFAMLYPDYREHAYVGDYPLQILLALNGKVHYFPEVMGSYRIAHDGSWTTKMNDNKKKKKHLLNEIAWLQELNSETCHKFEQPIYYRIALYILNLYIMNYCSDKDVRSIYKQLKVRKYRNKIRNRYLEFYIRKKFPKVYETLRNVKYMFVEHKEGSKYE